MGWDWTVIHEQAGYKSHRRAVLKMTTFYPGDMILDLSGNISSVFKNSSGSIKKHLALLLPDLLQEVSSTTKAMDPRRPQKTFETLQQTSRWKITTNLLVSEHTSICKDLKILGKSEIFQKYQKLLKI